MSKLKVLRSGVSDGVPHAQIADVGTYTVRPNYQPGEPCWVPHKLTCPYCRERMVTRARIEHMMRIVGDLGDGKWELAEVPVPQMTIVACLPCDARFIVPKDEGEWPCRCPHE